MALGRHAFFLAPLPSFLCDSLQPELAESALTGRVGAGSHGPATRGCPGAGASHMKALCQAAASWGKLARLGPYRKPG